MTSPRTDDTGLAARLRSLLADRNMSGRQLALTSGLSIPTCARVIRGDRDLTITELHAVADALDIPASELIGAQQGSAA